jgi:hypothetical protein
MGIIGFMFWSAVALVPVWLAVLAASRSLSRNRPVGALPTVAVITGFVVGGIIGWSAVPAQWTASLWTTIEAAGDSVKYGEAFEHTAERMLMYFLYSALLGEIAFGLAALAVAWRRRDATA